jgi:hypothetical protein
MKKENIMANAIISVGGITVQECLVLGWCVLGTNGWVPISGLDREDLEVCLKYSRGHLLLEEFTQAVDAKIRQT